MNILIISPGVLPIPAVDGGAVENLIEIFLEKNEHFNDNSITVYSCKSEAAKEKAEKNYHKCEFRYIETAGIKYKILKNIRWAINQIPGIYIGNEYINQIIKDIKLRNEEKKYDVVLVENSPMHVVPLSKIFKDNLYLHMHNDFINKNSKKSNTIIERCKKIITVSDYIANKIKEVKDIGNVETVINGIKTEEFTKKYDRVEELKKQYHIEKNDIVFMYTGRVTKDKGVLELVHAFKNMERKYKNIKLLIIGSSFFNNGKKDKYIKNLEKISEEIKDKVIFTGYMNHDELYKIYSIADVQIVPSLFGDACPLSVIEGVISGMPLIVSESGGIPEIVDSNNAEIVNISDKFIEELEKSMVTMYNNEEKRLMMKEYSRTQLERFSLKTYYNNLICKFRED